MPLSPRKPFAFLGAALVWSMVCTWFGVRAVHNYSRILSARSEGRPDGGGSAFWEFVHAAVFHAAQFGAVWLWVLSWFMVHRLREDQNPVWRTVLACVVALPVVCFTIWAVLLWGTSV